MPSSAYDDAVGATIRQTACKVILDLADMSAAPDATLSASEQETTVSRLDETINGNELVSPTQRWTTLEAGYFRLDGNNRIPPHPTQIISSDVGYWSESLSGEGGELYEPIVLTARFSVHHSSLGLSLSFDDEYPTEFTVVWYGDEDAELAKVTVFENDTPFVMIDQIVDDYTKIVITFNTLRNANRRLRVYEIIFGVRQTFVDDQIISASATREVAVIDEVLPSSEFNFELDNSDKRFNFLNPQGIYKYIQTKQLIKGFIGVYINDTDIEYVNVGRYYMDEWETDGITARFTGRDCLYFIPDSLQYTVSSTTTKTLKAWLETLFAQAGIDNYVIDDSLGDVSVATRWNATSIKGLIKSVCTAGCCIIYVDVNNVVQIKPIDKRVVGTITADNAYAFPKINLDSKYNTVKVGVWSSSSNKVTSYVTVNNIENNEEAITYEVADNPFITSTTMATDVANYYLTLLAHREIYNINWRQNPALDIADIVEVEDNFGVNGNVILTKQDYSYAGYLHGSSEGRGIDVATT